MMGLGWQELAIILVIVIIIFGAGKLPEIGSGLGKGIRGFKEEAGMDENGNLTDKKIEEGESTTASTLTSSAGDSRKESAAKMEDDKRERSIRADEI